MKFFKLTYILLIFLASCSLTKHIPHGTTLIRKDKLKIVGSKENLDEEVVYDVIKQHPNSKIFGIRFKLRIYNWIDSSKVVNKRLRLNNRLRLINKKRFLKEQRINAKRIKKAKARGEEFYTRKLIPLKDTVETRLFFREWLKYKVGEAPVVLDSTLFQKTTEQVPIFLKNKGYLHASLNVNSKYNRKRNKVKLTYIVETGELHRIDSVSIVSSNEHLIQAYEKFLRIDERNQLKGKPFDRNFLEDYRYNLAKFLRDEAFYGFSESHIRYIDVDTFSIRNKVSLKIQFIDRLVKSPYNRDSLVAIPHQLTTIHHVYFHILDTLQFKGNFSQYLKDQGLSLYTSQNYIRTIDTLFFNQVNKEHTDTLDPHRQAYFLFNGDLITKPIVIEVQNMLEKDNYYSEINLDKSYVYLQQLGIFSAIKIDLVELENTNKLDVHYYLTPAKRQSFNFSPRGTNSNGFLGVSASINYTNKNLFRGAENFAFNISGGFESQPAVFTDNLNKATSFNTFEFMPSIKMEKPGLYPIKSAINYKNQHARTILFGGYNFQQRSEFARRIFQLGYSWKFSSPNRRQVYQIGLPFLSGVKFVHINKTEAFEQKLIQNNDLFSINVYSNQFIWQDFRFVYEYRNASKTKQKINLYYSGTFDMAGNTLSLFHKIQDKNAEGYYTLFGLKYSQFARIDNQLTLSKKVLKTRSIHYRLMAGVGLPYGNSKTSMPYDYSFFGGGANDIRGWTARSLGPGSYKYYLSEVFQTQVADMRISMSLEYRFSFSSTLKGALFTDAGNIWTVRKDDNRPEGQISSKFINQFAIASGFGLRFDFDYFVARLDLAMPMFNPALPTGSRWLFDSMTNFRTEIENSTLSTDKKAEYIQYPKSMIFVPRLNFGIGYPF